MDQESEHPLRKTLQAGSKTTWDAIQEVSHIDEDRDSLLIWLLLDTLEEYKTLKSLLKKKRRKPGEPEPEDPRFHLNPNGTLQSAPVVNQLKEVRRDLVKQLSELALSPVSAARLTIMSDSDKDLILEALKSDRFGRGD
jgi:phage terminase small subunit